MFRQFGISTILVAISAEALATPPPPPAAVRWSREAWVCSDRKRSSIEIKIVAQGDSGYQLSVTELQIDGRQVDPASVEGLPEILARRNYINIVGGYCDRSGEVIDIEERASGADKHEAGWRSLRIAYGQ